MQPKPEPVDTTRLPELAQATMQRARFPMLATVDPEGRPRVRPVSPVLTEGFRVWVASFRSSHKTTELEGQASVELAYMDDAHDQVRIAGNAVLVDDEGERTRIWEATPLLRSFMGNVCNPEFMLYRVEPERVWFMREWALEYHDVPLEKPAQ